LNIAHAETVAEKSCQTDFATVNQFFLNHSYFIVAGFLVAGKGATEKVATRKRK